MTDLIAFLNARLDEDEAAAKAAWPGPWDLETEVGGFGPVAYVLMPLPGHKGARTGLTRYEPLGTQDADTAAHIARHDPARALREVEAKRAILESYASTLALVEHPPVMQEGHPYAGKISAQDYLDARRELAVLRPAIAVVAAIYSDHPDYQPEWAVA